MESLPASLAERLRELTFNERSVAYLEVDDALNVIGAGGHLDNYGLAAIRLGAPAVDQAVFLAGLLPLEETPFSVPSVELECGRAASVKTVLVKTGYGKSANQELADFVSDDLGQAADWILSQHAQASSS